MRNFHRQIVPLFFLFLFSYLCIGQKKDIKYIDKITIENGLAHNGVTSILEDSRGFIWFGTYDGLNKYNGYEITTFKNTSKKTVLTSNRVRTLSEDFNGNIWIGTDNGVTVYNYEKESFKKLDLPLDSINKVNNFIIRKIIPSNNTIVCATEGNGILIFDNYYRFIKRIFSTSNKNILFSDGVELDSNHILFTTSVGLVLYSKKEQSIKQVVNEITYSRTLLKLDANHLFIAETKGVTLVNFKKIDSTFKFTKEHTSLNEIQANSMMMDGYQNLWVGGIIGGIKKFPVSDFKKIITKKELRSFNDNYEILRSSSLMLSSNKHCWYTTFDKGVYKFNTKPNNFHHVGYNKYSNEKFGMISFISEYDTNKILITDNINGLSLYNTKTQKEQKIPFTFLRKSKQKIYGIYRDKKKHFWLNYFNDHTIFHLNENGEFLEKIILDKHIPIIQIQSYTEDLNGNIWIASTNTVYQLSLNKFHCVKSLEKLCNNTFFKGKNTGPLRTIYADPLKEIIWIGSETKGLFRVNYSNNTSLKKSKISQYTQQNSSNAISSNFVSCIIRLPNNSLWIGTEGGGICKVENSFTQPKFTQFTEADGLSNNVVKNILFDQNQNLWISTNIGLNKFDINKQIFFKLNKLDGLEFQDFWYSTVKLKNNFFVFSGLNGFCFFNPKKINIENKIPLFQFENFKLFDKKVTPNDTINNRVLISKNINLNNQINLKHNENVLSIDITSLHFSDSKNHLIRYQLHPINNRFTEITSRQKNITYAGLQPGEYTLLAQVSSASGTWSPTKKLHFTISPSIWQTSLAYFIYIILIISVIVITIYIILRFQKLNHNVQIEKLEKNALKKNNEDKLTFFSNISHEIKTPITLLSEPLKECLTYNKDDPKTIKRLQIIQRQTTKILKLIDEIHDFRKADAHTLKVNYSLFNFNDFIESITQDFTQLAINDHKNFHIIPPKKTLIVSADKDKIEKIINNLLNNAFKYTLKNNTITLSYYWSDNNLNLKVHDDGKGINKNDLPHIFERFFQSKNGRNNFYQGSGIGLAFTKQLTEIHYGSINVKSEINKGTTFYIELPILHDVINEEYAKPILLPIEEEIELTDIINEQDDIDDLSGEFSESLIYYVEDNTEMREYVSSVLSSFYIINSFSNGKECMDALEDKWPEIIISDIQMPIMNGLELCNQVKSNFKTSHIPVILLTALTKIEDHIQGIKGGADAYIKKPFSLNFLTNSIEALLINRKQLRERYQIGIPLDHTKTNQNDDLFLKKLFFMMEEKIENQEFDINQLAKDLYLNRTYFFKKVKALTNHTPYELLRKYRLKKAAELLSQQKLTVNEVYMMTGFKSRTHFIKIFKDQYNIPPSKYASSILKQ
ncbi:hybrid sensor histidine kinase/response regulator transcription factor [Wenyingzhuangia aestuarii]|uniref:hybrid sensor histidine kinase/response regulator transcription factor n=1 Tax=Wenyingzhuangia aestuarii TaxID=1647582 RepID=UPI0014395167|nr:hybrid sensor histidine kinase/response regulator transcription factor [Wenyingzhuangia aestuarii]NJB83145.1 signal transduction histidine kinase/ligand-binding sensor domain-containing protein/DNA-binding response OmpR family regulator [Wenyingzhuangia aestuarii]